MSAMSDESRRLDGNAAAGMLAQIFVCEMTSAECTCGECGCTAPLGRALMYGGQVGTVLRCPSCNHILMRVVHVPERGGEYWLDMRGMKAVRLAPSIPV